MKKIYLSLFSMCIMLLSFGQITVDYDSVFVNEVTAPPVEMVGHNNVNNTGNSTITLRWKKINETIPASWTGVQICDDNLCYSHTVSTMTIDVGGTRSTIIDAHFLNGGEAGTGTLDVLVYDEADSANTAKMLYFEAKALNPVAINELSELDVQLYPNPASNFLTISGLEGISGKVEVYNILGKEVSSILFNGGNTFKMSVADLQPGVYILKLYDNDTNRNYSTTFQKIN